MSTHLNAIAQLFPDFENTIEHLFVSSPDFRELCIDYMLCASKLLELKRQDIEYDLQVKEYGELQENLEQEILKIITSK